MSPKSGGAVRSHSAIGAKRGENGQREALNHHICIVGGENGKGAVHATKKGPPNFGGKREKERGCNCLFSLGRAPPLRSAQEGAEPWVQVGMGPAITRVLRTSHACCVHVTRV